MTRWHQHIMLTAYFSMRRYNMIKIALTLLLAAFAGNALAANINIGPNGCTLADAIDSANMNVAIGNCAPGSGSDFIIAPDNWVITLNSPLPAIISNMTIRSATPAGLLYINGDYNYRGLKITGNNTNVTLQRVHISEGKINVSNLQNPGAGIRIKNATVRLEDSLVVRNGTAQHPDSGIFMDGGDLTLVRSNVSSNAGTGIFAQDGSVHVVDSVISRNAFIGMSVYRSNLLVEGSLFDESWGGAGGAQTVAEFVNTTFTDTASGSYYASQAFGFSGSSLVTLNHVTSRLYFRLDDSMLSASNSFLFTCVLQASNVLLDTGNLYHSTETTNPDNCLGHSPTDYSLLPLADNGGPTKTHAIYDLTSAAINGGDPAYCATVDQRGEARGDACEVGAYEVTGFADVAVTASIMPGAPYVSAQNIVVNAEIKNFGPSPATNVRFDLGANSAYVTNVSSPFCNAIPCVIARIQPGQTLVIPIEMKLGSYFSSPFSMAFSAHTTASSTYVDADENDPSGNNVYNLSHAINQGADLALTLDLLTSGPYFVGQTIDYQARIDNAGAQTATGVEFHFGGYKLDNVVFSGCTSVSGLLCKLPNISSGYSHTVGIQAKITDDQFDVVGSVSAIQLDVNMGNNVDDRGNGGGVSDADIAVQARIQSSGPFHSLDYLEFQISIRTGNQPASNIRINLDFPGSDFISLYYLVFNRPEKSDLLISISNSCFGQVIRTHFEFHLITWKQFNVVHTHLARNVRSHHVTVF